MTFKDDDQSTVEADTITMGGEFDLVSVRFQMRRSEFDLIKDGLKSDMEYFIEWLQPTPE